MIVLALLAVGQTSPTVYAELPDLLPTRTRQALIAAIDTGEGALSLQPSTEPSGVCELRVRITAEREGRRLNLAAHLSAEADGLDPVALPLVTGRLTRRGRTRFNPERVERAATRLASEISTALRKLRCAPQAPTAPAEPTTKVEFVASEPVEVENPTRAPPTAKLAASLAVGQRSFAYRDFLYGNVRSVQLELTPLAALSVELLPDSALHAEARFTAALPTTEVAVPESGSVSLGTQWLAASLRVGARMGLSHELTVIVHGVGRYESFGFSGDIAPELEEGLPSLQHLSAGGGLELRYESDRVQAHGAAQGLYCFGFGDFIAERFPRATGLGFSAEASVLIPLADRMAVGPRAEIVRYGLSLNPEIAAANVAGGAVDQAWNAGIALEMKW